MKDSINKETYSLFRAVFLGLIPALLNSHLYRIAMKRTPNKKDDTNLSTLLLWYLLTLLHWDVCTLLRGHLPASGLGHLKNMLRIVRVIRGRQTATYVGADFLGG